MTIEFLRVLNGDSILIRFTDKDNNKRNILIDGGPTNSYTYSDRRTKRPCAGDLKLRLEEIKKQQEKIDLLVVTHIDDDHIGGILKWMEDASFSKENIGKIWFNSGQLIFDFFKEPLPPENLILLKRNLDLNTSIPQGVTFEKYILELDIWDRKIIKSQDEFHEFGITFKILSPEIKNLKPLLTKWEKEQKDTFTSKKNDYDISLKEHLEQDVFIEDNSKHNGSSIAFILTYEGKNFVFLADAHPSIIINGLRYFGYCENNKLKAKLIKVSHHGSKANTNEELLDLIDCEHFIISSNGEHHALPNKQCLARIIAKKTNTVLYFNYYSELIEEEKFFSKQDCIDFPNFKTLDKNKFDF